MIPGNRNLKSVTGLIKQERVMDKKKALPTICRQCRKDIKTEIIVCVPCDKGFHPSCHKLHKIYNAANELVPCKGKMEIFTIKGGSIEGGNGDKKRGSVDTSASGEGGPATLRLSGTERDDLTMHARDNMDNKIENIYKLLKETKDEMMGKEMIRNIIRETLEEEMNKIREQLQQWKTQELEALVREMVRKELSEVPILSKETDRSLKKTYSGAVKGKTEAVIIIKPKEAEEGNSSETTKKDIKNKIDISKLGVGITKLRKATRGAVVVGCESKLQADKLKEKVAEDLGEKYVVQEPKKRKLKIKIHDIDKEDCESEEDFWSKVAEQNECGSEGVRGKIIHKTVNSNSRGVTLIIEVDTDARKRLLDLGRVKIGWKICRVQDYVGILRCFKCCGYYHFAKDCVKKEACGLCAGQHMTKDCNSSARKCVNCEDKIKKIKIRNLKSDHSAYDNNCPCLKKEIEMYKSKMQSSI